MAYQQELMKLKLKYDLGLERFLLAFLEESIEEVKGGHFDLVVEKEDLLFSDTKTTVPENITDKLIQHMNLQSDSYFFMLDWIIFKTSWRSGNFLSIDK